MTSADQILSTPVAVSLLTIILMVVLAFARSVGPRRALLAELVRRPLARALHPIASRHGRPLIRDKTGTGEYIATVDASHLTLAQALWAAGYRWNPTATAKFRVVDGRRQWSVLSAAHMDSLTADKQHHVYVFPADRGLEVWGHREAPPTHPQEHVGGDEMVAGDPADRVTEALEQASIDYTTGPNPTPAPTT